MDAMFQQCVQMMSQMTGMLGSGMMGSGPVNTAPTLVWSSPWFWLGWVFVAAPLVLLIAAVVWMIRIARLETPLNILQRRLARGEVSPEQFETIKRQLA